MSLDVGDNTTPSVTRKRTPRTGHDPTAGYPFEMNCPVCKTTSLVMTERQAIEIDYCPDCRGVWLDRGELDKIIERSVEGVAASIPRGTSRPDSDAPRDFREDHKYGHDKRKHHYKKKSLLGELFDF